MERKKGSQMIIEDKLSSKWLHSVTKKNSEKNKIVKEAIGVIDKISEVENSLILIKFHTKNTSLIKL